MRYLLKTILLLLALSFVGAGVPLYMDSIDINRESALDEGTMASLHLNYEVRKLSGSEYEVDVWVDAGPEHSERLETYADAFQIQLFSEDDPLTAFSSTEQVWVLEEMNDPSGLFRFGTTLLLEQASLDLPDGRYRLLISPADARELFQEALDVPDIPLHFASIAEYVQARHEAPSGSTPLTLYFPDESSRHLVPITRFVPQTNTTLRETVTQLEIGPAPELSLFNRSPIPPVPRIQLSGGTASLYLSSNLGFYNEYSNTARMAARSLVESLGSIPEVRRIQFYFDNRILAEGFRDVATDLPLEPAEPPFIHVVYRAPNGRGFLVPRSAENPIISVPEIFQALTFDPSDSVYGFEIQPAVPRQVRLVDYALEENMLQLHLSQEVNRVFLENPVQGHLMLDALLFSMTSLDQVDSIRLVVDGREPADLPGRSLTVPITAPLFINPER